MSEPVTWISKDYHVHEHHSKDAPEATPTLYCQKAEERGINEICFTTHCFVTDPDVNFGVSMETMEEYMDQIFTAQDETDVTLRFGLELDYFPRYERKIEEIVDEYPFDFILGSLHYIRGIDIGSSNTSPQFFKGRPVEESLNIYYEDWGKAAQSGFFDVLAHPDYFRRYLSHSNIEDLTWEQYGTTIHEAFDILKTNRVGIEVNTSGYRHGLDSAYPITDFIKAAYGAGIKTVTIGSDTHTVEELGVNTNKGVIALQNAGFDYTCVFKNRKAKKINLSEVMMRGESLE